jgi:hypothetical protein
MVGSLVLNQCIEDRGIDRIYVYGRKAVPVVDPVAEFGLEKRPRKGWEPRFQQFISGNFEEFPKELRKRLREVEVVYFCLGAYTGQHESEVFEQITVSYPLALARALQQAGATPTFVLLSGAGAKRSGHSMYEFARYKGRAERELLKLFPESFVAVRPGYIYPTYPREEPNKNYERMKRWYPALKAVFPKASITSQELALVFQWVGMNKETHSLGNALENKELLALIKKHHLRKE